MLLAPFSNVLPHYEQVVSLHRNECLVFSKVMFILFPSRPFVPAFCPPDLVGQTHGKLNRKSKAEQVIT